MESPISPARRKAMVGSTSFLGDDEIPYCLWVTFSLLRLMLLMLLLNHSPHGPTPFALKPAGSLRATRHHLNPPNWDHLQPHSFVTICFTQEVHSYDQLRPLSASFASHDDDDDDDDDDDENGDDYYHMYPFIIGYLGYNSPSTINDDDDDGDDGDDDDDVFDVLMKHD